MPYNITIDDLSPMIKYTGQWLDSYKLAGDPYTNRYSGQSFHSSLTDGSQASLTFNGTAVYIFGAKRGNHGHYIVTIDNTNAQRFDGYAPTQPDGVDGVYQVPLFAQSGLSNGLHTVVLTNDGGNDAGRPYVDIDFITWTSNDPAGHSNLTIDDSAWNYTTPSVPWSTTSQYVGDYYNQTEHYTNVGGARASVTFEGTGFYFYAGTLNDHGMFNVQVDNQTPVGLNGSTRDYHPRQMMYYADGLGAGPHTLTVTNTQQGAYLDIDYVDVIQSASSPASSANPEGKAKTPIIAGVVCGVVIGIAWLIAAVWWFMRRKKRRAETADLLNEGKPYDAPPVGYGPATGGPGWTDESNASRNQPWANDPAFTGMYAQSGTETGTYPMSMYPPSSVSGSQGPGSSSGGGTSTYGGAAGVTRPSAQHQPLSSLTQVSEADSHVNELVPPPNIKGRPVAVPSTGRREGLSDDELRETRMRVPERPQDWGPLSDLSGDEYSEMLPPDYNQATEPFAPRRT